MGAPGRGAEGIARRWVGGWAGGVGGRGEVHPVPGDCRAPMAMEAQPSVARQLPPPPCPPPPPP